VWGARGVDAHPLPVEPGGLHLGLVLQVTVLMKEEDDPGGKRKIVAYYDEQSCVEYQNKNELYWPWFLQTRNVLL